MGKFKVCIKRIDTREVCYLPFRSVVSIVVTS